MRATLAWFGTVLRRFLGTHCSLHAAGLTYFSMLAVIPVLCFALVAAKAARVDRFARDQLNRQIDAFITNVEKGQDDHLARLTGPQSDEARERKRIAAEVFARQARAYSDQLFSKIEAFDVGGLGLIGVAMLLWTVISSLGNVEISMNEIWGVARERPLWKKSLLYLFVAAALPIFAALAMSIPLLNVAKDIIVATAGATSLTRWASDGLVAFIDSSFSRVGLTLLFSSFAFAYLFWVMPNRAVRLRHAWYAGLVTAVLFAALLKLCAVAQVGLARSSALYGSFAFLPIVLAWCYMSWQIILLGSCMAYAFGEGAAAEASKGKEREK